ncbi:MAG: hypothetical protein RDU20_10675, partial [Desulfomonilaceae bacterium]|nr:hypothetical protein [Desulfomonilaceae bacterium]
MAFLPGFGISVERNGTDVVSVTSGRVTRAAGQVGPSWEITLAEPMDISASDTWTIKRKLAGKTETLVSSAFANGVGGSDGVSGNSLTCTRRISGEADEGTNSLLEYCIPKLLCFVNWNWVHRFWPHAMIRDGELVNGNTGTRILGPRLPGKEFQKGGYEVIAGCYTHHDCARHLANLCGYDIEIGIPDIPLVDTFTVSAGMTWHDAIKKNLQIWFPVFEVIGTTIYVHDICVDEPVGIGKIVLTNDAIESASLNRNTSTGDPPLDHLIITGRRTENSEQLLGEEPDFTPITLAAIELEADLEIETSRDFTHLEQHKRMAEFSGQVGSPDEGQTTLKNLKNQEQIFEFHTDETAGRKRYVPLTETIHTYDTDDTEVAKTVVTYTYARG